MQLPEVDQIDSIMTQDITGNWTRLSPAYVQKVINKLIFKISSLSYDVNSSFDPVVRGEGAGAYASGSSVDRCHCIREDTGVTQQERTDPG